MHIGIYWLYLCQCGCDYTEKIEGIGPATAYKLVKEHENIEGILKFINNLGEKKSKYKIPERFLYEESRELFINPDVTDPATIDV
jgi:flap endonuclease-1